MTTATLDRRTATHLVKSYRLKDAWILGILLFFMTVHRPFVDLGLFSLKPFMVVMGFVILGLLFTMFLHGRVGLELPAALVAPTVTYSLISLLSALQATSPSRAVTLIVALQMVLILGLLCYRFAKRTTAEQAVEWICIAGIGLSLIATTGYVLDVLGIAPGLGFAYRGSPILGQFGDAPRMTGLHLDPNYFAQNMSIYSVTAFVLFLFAKLDIRLRRLVAGCFVLTTLGVLASLSRGGIVGIVVGIVLLATLNLRRTAVVLLRRKWLLLVAGVSFVGLITLIIPADARYFAVERLQGAYLQQELHRMNRLDLWKASWDMFIDHPLLGVGLGNTILLEQYYKYGWAIQIPHNTPLEVLTEAGVLGFLTYIWLIGSIFGTGWKSLKRARGTQRILLMGLLLAFLVAFVQAQFLSDQYEPALWGLWGVLLGTSWRARRGMV